MMNALNVHPPVHGNWRAPRRLPITVLREYNAQLGPPSRPRGCCMVRGYSTPRLLERDRERSLLFGAWREARGGRGSLWFVCAEAGGGKSRLAEELARSVEGRVLWGAAEPVAPPDPYLAVRRAVPEFEPASTQSRSVAQAVE